MFTTAGVTRAASASIAWSSEVSADTLRERPETRRAECPSCGSPNTLTLHLNKRGTVQIDAVSGYE